MPFQVRKALTSNTSLALVFKIVWNIHNGVYCYQSSRKFLDPSECDKKKKHSKHPPHGARHHLIFLKEMSHRSWKRPLPKTKGIHIIHAYRPFQLNYL